MFSGPSAPRHYRYALLLLVLAVLAWSGWQPKDLFTWFLEVAPVLIGLPLLILTFRHFPLTMLAYSLLALHAVILMVGGHYTYAEMPLFSWLRDTFDLARNHYDRVGHIAQGFIPAIVVREILLRRSPLRAGKWLFFLTTCVCLSISASYEFIEWWWRWLPATRRWSSSPPRATCGIPSGTCSWRCAGQSPRSCCSRACMTGNWKNAVIARSRR